MREQTSGGSGSGSKGEGGEGAQGGRVVLVVLVVLVLVGCLPNTSIRSIFTDPLPLRPLLRPDLF